MMELHHHNIPKPKVKTIIKLSVNKNSRHTLYAILRFSR
jgi:hypothetical protein